MRDYLAGDEPAFRVLFSRYGGKIYRYLVHFVGSSALAEDLTQQTWLQVHRARHSYRLGARFAPWLYTIAANLGRDNRRRAGRELLTSDGHVPEAATADPAPAADDAARVQKALLALPEAYREVIVLHRWHDLGFAEIAAVLGTTEGAVKLRAHRGYGQLRELLGAP